MNKSKSSIATNELIDAIEFEQMAQRAQRYHDAIAALNVCGQKKPLFTGLPGDQ